MIEMTPVTERYLATELNLKVVLYLIAEQYLALEWYVMLELFLMAEVLLLEKSEGSESNGEHETLPTHYPDAIARLRRMGTDLHSFSNLQLRAILRSAPGISKRIVMSGKDKDAVAVLEGQAKKIGISAASSTTARGRTSSQASATSRERSKSVHFEDEEDNQDWHMVGSRRSSSRSAKSRSRPCSPPRWGWPKIVKAAGMSSSSSLSASVGAVAGGTGTTSVTSKGGHEDWALIKADWAIEVLEQYEPGRPGVLFCPDQDAAVKVHGAIAATATHYVLLTAKELAPSSEEMLFRIKRSRDEICDARVLHGFITVLNGTEKGLASQPAPFRIDQTSTTTVLAAKLHRVLLPDPTWRKVQKAEIGSIRAVVQELGKTLSLTVMDVFKPSAEGSYVKVLLRVKVAHLQAWLTLDPDYGLCVRPMGDLAQEYGVVWQRNSLPKEQFQAFKSQVGFAGVIIKPDSTGIRVRKENLEELRSKLGLAGASWCISGLPINLDSDEVAALLLKAGWQAEPTSRRAVKGRSQWRARAKDPPPLAIMQDFVHWEAEQLRRR